MPLRYSMKGITLLALAKPTYGKFAYNLAVSIKYHSPDIPIQLIHDDVALDHLQPGHLFPDGQPIFDKRTVIDRADMYDDGVLSIGKAKMSLYKYLWFDETIYLDVDALVIKPLEPLFDEFTDDYHTTVVGKKDLTNDIEDFDSMQWAEVKDMIDHFGLTKEMVIPATNSSFQFIRKGKVCEKLFTQINANFSNKIPRDKLKTTWGKKSKVDGQPDELYLNVSLAQLGMWPKMKQDPMCFNMARTLDVKRDYANHYILCLFGGVNFTHRSMLKQYDRELLRMTRERYKRNQDFKVHPLMRDKLVDH